MAKNCRFHIPAATTTATWRRTHKPPTHRTIIRLDYYALP